MKMEINFNAKKIISLIVLTLFCCSIGINIYFIGKSKSLGREIDNLERRLNDATDTNAKLAGELADCRAEVDAGRKAIENCRNISTELTDTIERDVNTIGDCIELIRAIRKEIEDLENNFNSFRVDNGGVDSNISDNS